MKNTFLLPVFLFCSLIGLSQDLIRFTTTPIATNDLSSVISAKSFAKSDPVFFAFELNSIEKMKLHNHETLLIAFKLLNNGLQPIEEYKVIASQDENGVVRGKGVILPQENNKESFEINTIYKNDFHYRFLQEMKSVADQMSKWKLVIEEYSVSVYDNLKQRGVAIDFGVMSEDLARFPQFANKMQAKFTLKKPVSFNMEISNSYPFDAMIEKTNEIATAKKNTIYDLLSGETKAPKEYLSNDFGGYDDEIKREQVEKLATKFFEGTAYNWTKLSYFSNTVNIDKNDIGIPNYKYFYLGFYAKKKDEKCAFGTITIRSNYLGGGKYGDYKADTYKLTDCKCE
jgi:hypothetical protein